jgi:hypothetical protein
MSGEPGTEGVSTIEGGRARFNWQNRKRNDLKTRVEACGSCKFNDVCEGLWTEYLPIQGGGEFSAIK